MNKNTYSTVDPENNKIIIKADDQLKERQPILADFMDGIELDLDKLMKADF